MCLTLKKKNMLHLFILHVYACSTCHSVPAELRGQPVHTGSLFPPCESWGLNRSSSLAASASSFRAIVPVFDFVFNYKGSPDYHLKCRADKNEWPAVAMASVVFTFPRTRHLKFILACMHFLQNGQTSVTRSCCCCWFLQQ